jgi:fucose permease
VAGCLVLFGVGLGVTDVAMNVAGADVERILGRSVMPRFHAAYSLGTVAAAGLGAGLAGLGVPPLPHFVAVGAAATVLVVFALGAVLPGGHHEASRGGARQAWRERRTLLIGVAVLSLSLAEGAATDWLASGLVQGFEVGESTGIIGLAVFLVAMTGTRIAGTTLVDRWGRVRVLRASVVCALAGLGLYALAPSLVGALVGAGLWGLGAALGFPLGMSAVGDDPLRAAQRTAVVATIAYGAFLAGPPIFGWLAEAIGFRHALAWLAVPLIGALALAPVFGGRSRGTPSSGGD